MSADLRACLVPAASCDLLRRGELDGPDVALVEPTADGVHRVDLDPLAEARLVADQAPQLGAERVRQGFGEGRQQDARIGFARARWTARCRATIVLPVPAEPKRAPGREVALDELALGGMEEDRPLLPRDSPAPAPVPRRCVMTRKRRCASGCSNGSPSRGAAAAIARRAASGQFQQRLGRLGGQVVGQVEQGVLGRGLGLRPAIPRHAVAQQLSSDESAKSAGFGGAVDAASRRRRGTTISSDASRGSRPAGRRRSSDASRACGAPPSGRPCRGGRRSRAAGSPRSGGRSGGRRG